MDCILKSNSKFVILKSKNSNKKNIVVKYDLRHKHRIHLEFKRINLLKKKHAFYKKHLVDIKDLKNEVEELANKLALGPSLAFGKFKSLLHNSFLDSMEGQMEFESRMIAECSKTKDGINGIEAFVNKKEVSFTGD